MGGIYEKNFRCERGNAQIMATFRNATLILPWDGVSKCVQVLVLQCMR